MSRTGSAAVRYCRIRISAISCFISAIHTACICAAYSADGVTDFHRCKHNPLLAPTAGAWDADACYKPSALYDKAKDRWRIWYNGRAGGMEYIGMAEKHGDFTKDDFE